MKNYFQIKDGSIITSQSESSICIYSSPTEQEKTEILNSLDIYKHDLDSALDPDEISRVEFFPDLISIIWKAPKKVFCNGHIIKLDVSSIGFFLQKEKMIIISEEMPIFTAKEFKGIYSVSDILLSWIFSSIHHFLDHLKAIKQMTAELSSKVSMSLENKYLIEMFDISESLIYYLNAIVGNGSTLQKMKSKQDKFNLTAEMIDYLDDILIENTQCLNQARVYGSVLSGLMGARGTIVTNNMNVLLKNLTLVNIVFLPLLLLASMGGMSEFSMMTKGYDWRIAYPLFGITMVGLGYTSWYLINKFINKGTCL